MLTARPSPPYVLSALAALALTLTLALLPRSVVSEVTEQEQEQEQESPVSPYISSRSAGQCPNVLQAGRPSLCWLTGIGVKARVTRTHSPKPADHPSRLWMTCPLTSVNRKSRPPC